ncbi:MAG: thioredoxin domain-containing protein [Litorimonas sp.]
MLPIDSLSRRFVLLMAGAALALTACGGADTPTATGGSDGEYTVADDYILGEANAPVTLVEYASVSCGACAYWHQNVYPEIKSQYIDTGKVKYVFRPFPAGEPQMAQAGHKLALCADRTKFFKNIKLQFDRQSQIMEMGRKPNGLRQAYISLAKASGLSEDEFITCMGDADVTARYDAFVDLGVDQGVSGTPTIFINGARTNSDFESIQAAISPILGEPIPEKADAE